MELRKRESDAKARNPNEQGRQLRNEQASHLWGLVSKFAWRLPFPFVSCFRVLSRFRSSMSEPPCAMTSALDYDIVDWV